MSTPFGPAPQARTLRVLAAALCTMPLVLVVVLAVALPTGWEDEPPLPVVLGLVVIVAFSALTAEVVGFVTEPLDPAAAGDRDEVQRIALERFQTTMMLRFALTEMPILLGLAASFVLDHGIWPLVITAAISLPVMVFEVWPSRRNATKLAGRLESNGARSWLLEALGHA